MASYRLTRLLEEKVAAAHAHLQQLPRDLLARPELLQAIFTQFKIQIPQLAFDPDHKSYLPNGKIRLAIKIVEGEIYTLEDLMEDRYINRDLAPYQLEIRSGAREIWVEYGDEARSSMTIAPFPKQIFHYLVHLIQQVLVPEIDAANARLYQKIEITLQQRRMLA